MRDAYGLLWGKLGVLKAAGIWLFAVCSSASGLCSCNQKLMHSHSRIFLNRKHSTFFSKVDRSLGSFL